MNGANVQFSWTISDQPSYSTGGQPITAYDLQILLFDGSSFSGEATYCVASSHTLTNLFCEVPMSVLVDAAGTFRLPLGRLIQAKVSAQNLIGSSTYSALNTAGVVSQTEPLKPVAPTRDGASNQIQLVVNYAFSTNEAAPAGLEDGGSTIISLNLQWDQGTAGASWVSLIGEYPYATTSTYTAYLESDGSNSTQNFKFRVRALNVHGWSQFSDEVNVLAAEVPGVIASTEISIVDGTQVRFAWQTPAANGSPIDAYKLEIQASDLSYVEETAYCSGAVDPSITLNAACQMPMSAFVAAPFNLAHDTTIVYRISARNAIGWQPTPSTNSIGSVQVQTSPQGTPAPLNLNAAATDETQITVEMTQISDSDVAANGGSPILSYSLEWDWGTSGAGYVAVTGYVSNSLQLLYTATGLTAGKAYQFRYRVRNTYGWGAYSQVLVAVAANPPSTPTQPLSSNTGTSIRLNWAEPYTGGSAILELDIEIRASDGSFFPELLYCNGVSDVTVRS
jgi:hypothetical protein